MLKLLILVAASVLFAEGWYWLGSRVDGIPIPFTHGWLSSLFGSGQEDHDSLLHLEMIAFSAVSIAVLYWALRLMRRKRRAGDIGKVQLDN